MSAALCFFFHCCCSRSYFWRRFLYLSDVGVRTVWYSVRGGLRGIDANFPVDLFRYYHTGKWTCTTGVDFQAVTHVYVCVCVCASCVYVAVITLSCFHVPLFSHLCNAEHTLSWCVCSFVCRRDSDGQCIYVCKYFAMRPMRYTHCLLEEGNFCSISQILFFVFCFLQITGFSVFIYYNLKMKLQSIDLILTFVTLSNGKSLHCRDVWEILILRL